MTIDTKDISWKDLGCKLSKNTNNALKCLKFEKPTPIQTHVIPKFLQKKDLVAQAVTGSGKTLAFIIPIIELLNEMDSFKSTDVFSVILSPTSELANQTYEMFNNFLSNFNGSKPNLILFNKKSESSNSESNKGIVIISTPGSFAKAIEEIDEKSKLTKSLKSTEKAIEEIDEKTKSIKSLKSTKKATEEINKKAKLIKLLKSTEKAIKKNDEKVKFIKSLKSTEILILDEADRLLEMGFEDQLMTIIKSLPKQRLTSLFSATQTTEVENLIRAGLRNPVRISVKVKHGEESDLNDNLPKNMTNYYMLVEKENKIDILVKFLEDKKDKKILIFMATCDSVDYYKSILSLLLRKRIFLAFHKKIKSKREKIFKLFKEMKSGVMLCTDVMARGIDIPDIDWVVQFDPPQSATNFVHRCGRTARCEQFGETLLLLRSSEDTYVHFLRENQNVEMKEFKASFDIEQIESYETRMQDLCIADRLLYEKSVNSFIAYVMFYRKHDLKYIFKLSNLNIGKLANSFGLLRIPQMAELKGVDLSDFHKRDVDLKTLIYKDKSVRKIREKTRIIKRERREIEAMEVGEEDEENITKKQVKSNKKNRVIKQVRNSSDAMEVEIDVDEKVQNKSSKANKKKGGNLGTGNQNKRKTLTDNSKSQSKKMKVNSSEKSEGDEEAKTKSNTKKIVKIPIDGKGILASFNKPNKM